MNSLLKIRLKRLGAMVLTAVRENMHLHNDNILETSDNGSVDILFCHMADDGDRGQSTVSSSILPISSNVVKCYRKKTVTQEIQHTVRNKK